MALVQQCNAINKMLNEMCSLVPIMLPQNRPHARSYLYFAWETITTVSSSLIGKWSSKFLEEMYGEYIQSEEDRIRRNLSRVKYRIDGLDTMYLVTGPRRIEKNFFALVKVLLERHLQIFHMARTRVLHPEELDFAVTSIESINQAIYYRLFDLKVICSNNFQDIKEWLQRFAHGLYIHPNNVSLVWSFDKVIEYEYDQSVYKETTPFDDSNFAEILSLGEGRLKKIETSDYEVHMSTQLNVVGEGAPKGDAQPPM